MRNELNKSKQITTELRALDNAHEATIRTYKELIDRVLEKIQTAEVDYNTKRAQLTHAHKQAINTTAQKHTLDGEMPVTKIAHECGLVIANLRQTGRTCDITLAQLRVFTLGLLLGQRAFQWYLHTQPENFHSEDFDRDLVRAVFTQLAPTLKLRTLRTNVMPSQTLMVTMGALIHDNVLTQENVNTLASLSWHKMDWSGIAVGENTQRMYGMREGGARTYAHMVTLLT